MRGIWLAVGAYVAIVGLSAVWRWHLWTFGADTGLFTQVVSDAFGGFHDGSEDGSHFRFHWAPVLASLWPLVAATHSPLSLQFAQIALIAACAFPLHALARTYLGDRPSAAVASLALLYPPLLGVAFTEFHEIAFYPVLALASFWAADRARWAWFAAFAGIASLVREDTCIVLAIVGATFAALGLLRRDRAPAENEGLLVGTPREPRALAVAGLGLAALNLAVLYLYFGILIPRLGGWAPSHFYDYPFSHGHGPLGLAAALLGHPADIASLATAGRLTYVLEALVPLALLPLFSPWSLLGLPGMLLLLLASDQVAWRMGGHYPAIWIPWLLVGSVATLVGWQRAGRTARVRRWTVAALALCGLFLIAFDPLHPLHYMKPPYDESDDVRRALATIPADAHVALHDEWYTRIAYGHPHATVFVCPDVDMLVYADDFRNGYFEAQIVPEIRNELASGQARVLRRFGHVTVYARKPDRKAVYGNCKTGEYGHFATLRQFLDYSSGST